MITFINIFIVLLLILMNSFFVATEFSIVKIRKSRIETLVMEGKPNAKYALKVANNLNSYLSACQLGITLASLGLGWKGEPAVADLLMPLFKLFHIPANIISSLSFIIGFALITGLEIVLGELAPKSIAIINTEKIALSIAPILIVFYKITYPIMWTFGHSTNLVLKLLGIKQVEEHEEAHTDEEIKLLVEESYEQGLIDKTELTFVDNIFDFSDKTCKDVMIPRTDMVCIGIDDPFDKIIDVALKNQLTRYPVCKEGKDNIIGFVHIKDLYKQKIQGTNYNIGEILRDIKFVPEALPISELFKIFQKEKTQMAIVIDEYGGTSGLLTIEDILEEIVGDIHDEFDEDGKEIAQTDNDNYVVDGKVVIENINKLLDINIEDENIDTIGGWVYSQLTTYPQVNDKVTYDNYEFIVLKCDRKRISKVLIKNMDSAEITNQFLNKVNMQA